MKSKTKRAVVLAVFVLAGVINTGAVSVSSAADSGIEKLKWHEEPIAAPQTAFQDGAGADVTLADYAGKVVVVNLWATWCAPCIHEMPTLDALQADLGGARLKVIALSQDREGERVARPFIEKNGWSNLDLFVSDGTSFAREAKVRGLPTTLIISPEGLEVARLEGTAVWDAPEIKAVLTELMAPAS